MKIYPYLAALGLLSAGEALAALADPRINGAKQCTQHLTRQERIHGIPSNLLAAIANTESGRWNDTLSMVLPWPWTINAEGKGYYFDSKAEAVRKVKQLQRRGMKSIDIGCMQVNLKHHPDAFASVEQAFDPRYNVAYAAEFLRSHFDEMNNWQQAIAAYHSKTPKYGNKYRARVQKSWNAITGKVRLARAAMQDMPQRYRPSYRVISVRDAEENEAVKTTRTRRMKKPVELALHTDDKTASGKMMPLRAQDRLSQTPLQSVKRISVSKHKRQANTTIIRPKTASSREQRFSAEITAPSQSGNTDNLFVSHHGERLNTKNTGSTVKPKFVFVD